MDLFLDSIRKNDITAIKNLILEGNSIYATDKNGYSVLHHAAEMGKADSVSFFIRNGLKPGNVKDTTPLMLAINNRHYDVVETMLKLGVKDVSISSMANLSALNLATKNKDPEMIELLLKYDFSIVSINEINNADTEIKTIFIDKINKYRFKYVSEFFYILILILALML